MLARLVDILNCLCGCAPSLPVSRDSRKSQVNLSTTVVTTTSHDQINIFIIFFEMLSSQAIIWFYGFGKFRTHLIGKYLINLVKFGTH